ncbi:D-amino-acid dehydrogenase [Rhizobium sp. RU20A]|uniref:NAD(P)/FAD-dependent oxidoreductase n=1 Tax=Rhizobium sp. RU20A TaxID=1907412 RepID=UPI0009554154|nr:FAD-dependent oxidoreductase [Rhizobium sp. RU20A]SIQ99483.1 D-amino-acid dehydrogenase [Rhizobium sp. RU20A]
MARIGIAGGGIIASAAAVELIARGHDVTVFERDPDGKPASVGNAALLAVPEIAPLANVATLMAAPKWLLDPLGPLALRWQDIGNLAPWLIRFALAARPSTVENSRKALLSLMLEAEAAHVALGEAVGLTGHMRPTGAIHVFDSKVRTDAAYTSEREAGRLLGFDVEWLDTAAARARVPALEGPFAGAVYASGYRAFKDPAVLLAAARDLIRARGSFVSSAVKAVLPRANGVAFLTADGSETLFDKVLVASGVWSRDLLRPLGLTVCLETERGYNTTYDAPLSGFDMPVFFSEHGFCATPLEGRLRVGGAVELARPEAPANYARARAMREKMRRYVPSLPETGGTEWMGCRPSTPDSIPVISLAPSDPRIAMAFGHGHLGLTLSAVTARRVCDLLEQGDTEGARPFSIARFQ